MTDSNIKLQITEDMKTAMRSKDKERLAVIRLILAAIKQIEVDQRIELSDQQVIAVLDKMCKQRRESIAQFLKAERQELVDTEESELKIIQEYLPAQLSEQEIKDLIIQAVSKVAAQSIKDMGKVMAELKPKLAGRADMSQVSQMIKQALAT